MYVKKERKRKMERIYLTSFSFPTLATAVWQPLAFAIYFPEMKLELLLPSCFLLQSTFWSIFHWGRLIEQFSNSKPTPLCCLFPPLRSNCFTSNNYLWPCWRIIRLKGKKEKDKLFTVRANRSCRRDVVPFSGPAKIFSSSRDRKKTKYINWNGCIPYI